MEQVTLPTLTKVTQLEALPEDAKRMELSPSLISSLQQFAGAGLRAADAHRHSGRFLVEFSPEGTKALREGSQRLLKLTKGGMQPTLTKGGRFKENARLVGGAGRSALNAVSLVIMIVVNERLARMERTLKVVEAAVRDLHEKWDDLQVAELRAARAALTRVYTQMAHDEHTDERMVAWRVTLDDVSKTLEKSYLYHSLRAQRHMGQYRQLCSDVRKAWGPLPKNRLPAFSAAVENIHASVAACAQALEGRAAVAYMRMCMGDAPVELDLDNPHTESLAELTEEFARFECRWSEERLQLECDLVYGPAAISYKERSRQWGAAVDMAVKTRELAHAVHRPRPAQLILELDEMGEVGTVYGT